MNESELNNVELNFSVGSFEVKESEKDGWLRIGGEALRPLTSRNGITYTVQNIEELDGSKTKFFMTHELTPDNVVGHVKFAREGERLMYDARIRNTEKWKDVTESAKDKFFEVSIDARYNKLKRVTEEKETKYILEGMEMRGLCGVGVGGVPTNSVEYAIAEEFKKKEGKDVNEIIQEVEVTKLADEQELEKIAKENDALKKQIEEFKAKEAEREKDAHNRVVEELLKVNSELDKNELSGKSVKELEMMLSYEKKLAKVKEEEEEEEGSGEVEDEGEEIEVPSGEESEHLKGVIIEKDGDITMNSELYDKFNKEVREQLR